MNDEFVAREARDRQASGMIGQNRRVRVRSMVSWRYQARGPSQAGKMAAGGIVRTVLPTMRRG